MAERLTLARPYAKAAFVYAAENNKIDIWAGVLANLALIARDEKVQKIIKNRAYSKKKIAEFFTEIDFVKNAGKQICNFLNIIAEYNRLDLLVEISLEFQVFKDNYNKEINIDVILAMPATAEQKEAIKSFLLKKTQHNSNNLNLEFKTDATLLGGLVIIMGNKVLDASIKKQLNDLSEFLLK